MSDRDLTEDEAGAVDFVVRGRRAWSDEPDLIAGGFAAVTLAGLASLGWLAPWDIPGLPRAWTLTPWAAERLRVWAYEHWEYLTTIEPDKDDEGGKARRRRRRRRGPADCLSHEVAELLGEAAPHEVRRTRDPKKPAMVRVSNVVEVPRWAPDPPPREPGMPKPPKVPVVLPRRIHECRLPPWMSESWAAPDEDPVRAMLDAEKWVTTEVVGDDGRPAIDEATGMARRERLTILGMEIPRAKPERKKGKKKGRKRKGPGDKPAGRPAA